MFAVLALTRAVLTISSRLAPWAGGGAGLPSSWKQSCVFQTRFCDLKLFWEKLFSRGSRQCRFSGFSKIISKPLQSCKFCDEILSKLRSFGSSSFWWMLTEACSSILLNNKEKILIKFFLSKYPQVLSKSVRLLFSFAFGSVNSCFKYS